jgi:hypothetical protein
LEDNKYAGHCRSHDHQSKRRVAGFRWGFWSNVVEEGAQGNDLNAVGADPVLAADAATTADIANATLSGGGIFGPVAAAETAFHTAITNIYQDVERRSDGDRANYRYCQYYACGLVQPVAALADPANASGANLAQIGLIFNDLVNKSYGGFVDQPPPRPK